MERTNCKAMECCVASPRSWSRGKASLWFNVSVVCIQNSLPINNSSSHTFSLSLTNVNIIIQTRSSQHDYKSDGI